MRRIALVLLLACLAWPGSLKAALPEGLAGRWSGTAEAAGRTLTMLVTLRPDGNGFEVDLALADIAGWQSQMAPTDRPGVYQSAADRSLFGFFDGRSQGNPFDGAPLIWSRTTAQGLVVYRLVISNDGVAELLRIAMAPTAQGLEIAIERRRDSRAPETWRARLTKGG